MLFTLDYVSNPSIALVNSKTPVKDFEVVNSHAGRNYVTPNSYIFISIDFYIKIILHVKITL